VVAAGGASSLWPPAGGMFGGGDGGGRVVLNRTSMTVMLSLPLGVARQCVSMASQMAARLTFWTTTNVRATATKHEQDAKHAILFECRL
jgi:hypothetical protein